MQTLGDIFCPICLDYFCRPVTAVCGHSFCELCLEEYLLHFEECPLCEEPIRKEKTYRANALTNFVEHFLSTEHPQQLPAFQLRAHQLQQFREGKALGQFSAGDLVDVRDSEYTWRPARILRIISRVGEFHKYIKLQYMDCDNKQEEELKVTSDRVARPGFYTGRADLPKYQDKHNSIDTVQRPGKEDNSNRRE